MNLALDTALSPTSVAAKEEVTEEPKAAPAKVEKTAAVANAAANATPLAKEMMKQNNVSSVKVSGSGSGGRITKADMPKTIARTFRNMSLKFSGFLLRYFETAK